MSLTKTVYRIVSNEMFSSHWLTFKSAKASGIARLWTLGQNSLPRLAFDANLEIVERENLGENARLRGKQISESLLEMKDKHAIVGDVPGVALIQGVEFVKDRETKRLSQEPPLLWERVGVRGKFDLTPSPINAF